MWRGHLLILLVRTFLPDRLEITNNSAWYGFRFASIWVARANHCAPQKEITVDDPAGGGKPPNDRSPEASGIAPSSQKAARRGKSEKTWRSALVPYRSVHASDGEDHNGTHKTPKPDSADDTANSDSQRIDHRDSASASTDSLLSRKKQSRRSRRRWRRNAAAANSGRADISNRNTKSSNLEAGNRGQPKGALDSAQKAASSTDSREYRHRREPVKSDNPAAFAKPAVKKDPTSKLGMELARGPSQPTQRNSEQRNIKNKNNSRHFEKRRAGACYAALDLGTNNCRLLVAVPDAPGKFKVVDAFSRIVRLGEGLGASGRLKQSSMDRAIEALRVCAAKLAAKNIRMQRLIATEACRRAENGEFFLERVKNETGLELEIINRRTEARLAVAGCSTLVGKNTDGVVLFDIGGGSSELALLDVRACNNRRISDHIVAWTSMPVGVVTLAEKYGGKQVDRFVFDAMVADVMELIERFEGRDALKEACQSGRMHLLGTSGTVTTLAGVHLQLPRYDRNRVDGIWMDDRDVSAMIEKLLAMDYQDRSENPCIGKDRADLVLAGCAILEAIRQNWPCSKLRVADRGLREGLLIEMMSQDGAWHQNKGRRNQRSRPRINHGKPNPQFTHTKGDPQ